MRAKQRISGPRKHENRSAGYLSEHKQMNNYRDFAGVTCQHEEKARNAGEDGQQQTARKQNRPVPSRGQIDQRIWNERNGGEEEKPRAQ